MQSRVSLIFFSRFDWEPVVLRLKHFKKILAGISIEYGKP